MIAIPLKALWRRRRASACCLLPACRPLCGCGLLTVLSLSRAHSIAAVSPWSSLCTSVRRTCPAFARESIRSCVTMASMIDWLPDSVRWSAWLRSSYISYLVFQRVQEACLVFWQAEEWRFSCSPGELSKEPSQSRFLFAFLQRTTDVALYWPTADAGSTWTDFSVPDFILMTKGHRAVLVWTCRQASFQPGPMGWNLWFSVWVALTPIRPF